MAVKKKKILFIEDEPDQILMVTLRLERNDYQVVSTTDGETGLKMAAKEKPDLILLDVIMPGLDGLEVCHRLKGNPATRHIPVITATAAGLDDVEHKCFTAGADDCIRKPYDSADLLRKVRSLLER